MEYVSWHPPPPVAREEETHASGDRGQTHGVFSEHAATEDDTAEQPPPDWYAIFGKSFVDRDEPGEIHAQNIKSGVSGVTRIAA